MALNNIRQYGSRTVPLLKNRISFDDIVDNPNVGGSKVPASASAVKKVQQNVIAETADRIKQNADMVGDAGTNGNTLGKLEKLVGVVGKTSAAGIAQEVSDRNSAIEKEAKRAVSAEKVNADAITKEVSDRETAITNLGTSIDNSLKAEAKRANEAEADIASKLTILNGDESVDGSIAKKVMVESGRAKAEEDRIEKALTNEIATRTAGVATKNYTDSAVSMEKNRSLAAEAVLTKDVNGEVANRVAEVSRLDTKINTLDDNLNDIKNASDKALQNEVQTRTDADGALSTRLSAVEGSLIAGVTWKGSVANLDALNKLDENSLISGQAYYVTAERDVYIVVSGIDGDYKPADYTRKSFLKIADFKELTGLVTAEKTRAVDAENTLANGLKSEISNRMDAIKLVQNNVTAEKNRALAAEKTNADSLVKLENASKINDANLRKEFGDAEKAIQANLENEAKILKDSIESNKVAMQKAIKAESDRALAAEAGIDSKITVLNGDSGVVGSIASKIKVEADRAVSAEKVNADALVKEVSDRNVAIKAEADRAMAAEKVGTEAITKEISDRENAIKTESVKTGAKFDTVNTKLDVLNGDKNVAGSVANAEHKAKLYANEWIPSMNLEGMDGKLKVVGDNVTVLYKPMSNGIIYGEVIVYDPKTGDAIAVNVASVAENVITLDTVTANEFNGFACKVQYLFTKGEQLGDSKDQNTSSGDGKTA